MDSVTATATKARIAGVKQLISTLAPQSGSLKETKILMGIVNILNVLTESANDMCDDINELADYTESLHEALCNIEESVFCVEGQEELADYDEDCEECPESDGYEGVNLTIEELFEGENGNAQSCESCQPPPTKVGGLYEPS